MAVNMHMRDVVQALVLVALGALSFGAWAQDPPAVPELSRNAVDKAVGKVKPALVRIHVVETWYGEGREMKYESSGSGAVISPEGHVITNHHVAGHAKQLKCVFADKSEVEAELVGTDPLTDIAIIKLKNSEGKVYPTVSFGDSDAVQVGDQVLAMGSPLALSQSVTLGIISNTEMTMPEWLSGRGRGLEQDGEDVGALVRWLAHDAVIFGGNSGGPLVNLSGEIIGINEIKMGLGGAIPGNLAQEVARSLMAEGKVRRAWLGIEVQPRLKHDKRSKGVLVGGVIKESPAEKAGIQSGDLLLALNGTAVDAQFLVQLPDFNSIVARLPIEQPISVLLEREGAEHQFQLTPMEREAYQPDQFELKQWGITVRDISYLMAKDLKRPNAEGVLVTSVRAGGPAGDAKPVIKSRDVLVSVNGKAIKDVAALRGITSELTAESTEPLPILTGYERKTSQFLTVVEVGIRELEDPGLEVKKAWLPVETQVLTRDIAEVMGQADLTGFRVVYVYAGSTAEKAGLKVGDLILAVDGEPMTASAPEHYEELSAWIRQYRVGDAAELSVLRGEENLQLSVELVRAPKLDREMKKFRDNDFEFTVREVSFFDKATEQWASSQEGVLVDAVESGGWAALGNLGVGDLLLEVDGIAMKSVADVEARMTEVAAQKPAFLVFKVLRGIHMFFIELEPKWEQQ